MSHRIKSGKRIGGGITSGYKDGDVAKNKPYNPPKIANPGSVIYCAVGGGKMGHHLASENEAPFPLKLCEFFVKSFCPPDGTVLDCFCGSGSAGHAAMINGRNFIGCDIRQSQVDLSARRLREFGEVDAGTPVYS